MTEVPPPIEWVPGSSSTGWAIGFALVVVGSLAIGDILVAVLIGPTGPPNFVWWLKSMAILSPVLFTGMVLWILLVPSPVSMLGVSPGGILIPGGARDFRFPWSRAFVTEDRLYVVSRLSGLVVPYRLTPYQAARVRSVRPG